MFFFLSAGRHLVFHRIHFEFDTIPIKIQITAAISTKACEQEPKKAQPKRESKSEPQQESIPVKSVTAQLLMCVE
ncbi:hypothetical protein Nepgr_032715 [Nepenthes gracilis]|uniref:Uncharacterized protein n=1 Tax=Nepenthes gracilis TaxID=150966 RepID=A0AAD3TLD1_NEPGR|nr:hypothetical protein Nepgr_032715 [Nepenthes gracilis]